MNEKEPFYKDGLCFSCNQCGGESRCCRGTPGVVELGKSDLARLAKAEGLTEEQFIQVYCRWIPIGNGREFLSLRDLSNYDCILWDKETNGCSVYEARPAQCRTYPFWPFLVDEKASWDSEQKYCPGINCGALHSKEEIEREVALYKAEERITHAV